MKKRLIFLFLSCWIAIMATAQDRTISGVVQEKTTKDPLPGVTIQEKGTTNGTVTDMSGKFTLAVKPGAVLQVSFIGMESQEVTVGNSTSLQIQLEASTEEVNQLKR